MYMYESHIAIVLMLHHLVHGFIDSLRVESDELVFLANHNYVG